MAKAMVITIVVEQRRRAVCVFYMSVVVPECRQCLYKCRHAAGIYGLSGGLSVRRTERHNDAPRWQWRLLQRGRL